MRNLIRSKHAHGPMCVNRVAIGVSMEMEVQLAKALGFLRAETSTSSLLFNLIRSKHAHGPMCVNRVAIGVSMEMEVQLAKALGFLRAEMSTSLLHFAHSHPYRLILSP